MIENSLIDPSVLPQGGENLSSSSGQVENLNSKVEDVYTRNHRIITDPELIQQKLRKQSIIADRQRTFHPKRNRVSNFLGCLPPFQRVAFDSKAYNASGFLSETISSPRIWNNVSCKTAIASLQGSRASQDDVGIASSFTLSTPDGKTHKVFLSGIFDGHAGWEAAWFMKSNLQEKLKETFEALFKKTLPETHPLKPLENETTLSDVVIWNVLKIACVELDERFNGDSGTTAAFSLLIDGEDLWHANIGDSRSFITSGRKTIQLSEDMKLHFNFGPQLTKEAFETRFKGYFEKIPKDSTDGDTSSYPYNNYERSVWKRGGHVFKNGLNGVLSPARAIGDRSVGAGLCPRPKITKTPLLTEFTSDDFVTLVHASDGIWDAGTTDEFAAEINSDQAKGIKLADTIKDLVYSALNTIDPKDLKSRVDSFSPDKVSGDNTTIVATKLDLRELRLPAQESKSSCIVS